MKFLAFGNNDNLMESILMDDVTEIRCAGGHEIVIKNQTTTVYVGPIRKEDFTIDDDNRISLMKRLLSSDTLDYNFEYNIPWKEVRITHIRH